MENCVTGKMDRSCPRGTCLSDIGDRFLYIIQLY